MSIPSKGLPDFIIGGAMKSGTTTLHRLLAQHPRVFMPASEVHFFSLDDVTQHAEFSGIGPDAWTVHDLDRDFDTYLKWYRSLFEAAEPTQLIGEDSTVYLASEKAPERIARLLPEVRLIFLLRDPVARTYSHYWHMVQTGRAVYDFEKTLQYAPETLITRSLYRPQLERYLNLFPKSQILCLIFEPFIRNLQSSLDQVCTFLQLQPTLDVSNLQTRFNTAAPPRMHRLQLIQNRIFRHMTARKIHHQLSFPNRVDIPSGAFFRFQKRADTLLRRINRSRHGYPPMHPETRRYLERLFAHENAGLADLTGLDLKAHWPYMLDPS